MSRFKGKISVNALDGTYAKPSATVVAASKKRSQVSRRSGKSSAKGSRRQHQEEQQQQQQQRQQPRHQEDRSRNSNSVNVSYLQQRHLSTKTGKAGDKATPSPSATQPSYVPFSDYIIEYDDDANAMSSSLPIPYSEQAVSGQEREATFSGFKSSMNPSFVAEAAAEAVTAKAGIFEPYSAYTYDNAMMDSAGKYYE